jgi:hypothetical protein
MDPTTNIPRLHNFGNSLVDEYVELVAAFKALQTDYENIGFRNDAVYARSCHALHNADKSMKRMQEIIKGGEKIEDFQENLGRNN